MTNVTVHSFMVPDIREGALVEAKGKATRETIASLHGVVIEHTEQSIDASLLNETGRYHEPHNSQHGRMV
jgi:hypothetical protein